MLTNVGALLVSNGCMSITATGNILYAYILICHSLLHCIPTSRVRGHVSSAGASNSSTIARCWAFASLALLSFLCLGEQVKQNTVGTASGLRVCLDVPYPSNTGDMKSLSLKCWLQTQALESCISVSTKHSFSNHRLA